MAVIQGNLSYATQIALRATMRMPVLPVSLRRGVLMRQQLLGIDDIPAGVNQI